MLLSLRIIIHLHGHFIGKIHGYLLSKHLKQIQEASVLLLCYNRSLFDDRHSEVF